MSFITKLTYNLKTYYSILENSFCWHPYAQVSIDEDSLVRLVVMDINLNQYKEQFYEFSKQLESFWIEQKDHFHRKSTPEEWIQKMTKQFKPAKLSAIDEDILTVLKNQRELYGLEILDCLNLERKNKLGSELGFGSLYPALNRLEKKGLINWRWSDDDKASGGARRKYYKINDFGLYSLNTITEYRIQLAE